MNALNEFKHHLPVGLNALKGLLKPETLMVDIDAYITE